MLSMVKMPLKGEVGGPALNDHGNYIVDHGKSWKNHGILFLNFCGNPGICIDGAMADQLLPQLLMEQFDTLPIQYRHIEHVHEGVWFRKKFF